MAYYHYSEKLFKLDKGFNYKERHKDNLFFLKYKPQGLWISVDDDWEEWCKDSEFALERLKYRYKVNVLPSANILLLETADQIDAFSKEFVLPEGEKFQDFNFFIDWDRVSEDYQGLIVSPYQWDCRLNPFTLWYSGWDCASGCIWDLNAIESIESIELENGRK